MAADGVCLGVCYAYNHLYYSVGNPDNAAHLMHIGSIDFNFNVQQAIITGDPQGFPALKTALEDLKNSYSCNAVRIISPAVKECWTTVPRSVYEDSAEREAHLSLLMQGSERNQIETTWHSLSNVDYRMLLLRNQESMQGFNHLLGSFSDSEYVAEFEIGAMWQYHTQINGSFLMIHCQKNYLSVSSYVLGKLRACTYIHFESLSDLPYFWNLYSTKLTWLKGIHEEIYVFGQHTAEISDFLAPYWNDSGEVQIMNNLQVMQVNASEKTYGFPLEGAFPAIMLSLHAALETNQTHENYNG